MGIELRTTRVRTGITGMLCGGRIAGLKERVFEVNHQPWDMGYINKDTFMYVVLPVYTYVHVYTTYMTYMTCTQQQ